MDYFSIFSLLQVFWCVDNAPVEHSIKACRISLLRSEFELFFYRQCSAELSLIHPELPPRIFAGPLLLSFSAFDFIFSLFFRFWAVR